MCHRPKWVWFVLLAVISLNMVYFTFNQSITSTDASIAGLKDYPRLFVTKVTEKSEVVIGEDFIVTITIKNIGNKTAYNVTYIDQLNHPWIFEVSGLTQLAYGQIGANDTRQFSYLVTGKSIGTYDLFAAKIEYYDAEINPTKLVTISNKVEITVKEPPEDFSLANFNAAITFSIVLVVLNILLFIRLIAPKLDRRSKIS
jgi:uncharacterized repeat protein (TIGR01451 family)